MGVNCRDAIYRVSETRPGNRFIIEKVFIIHPKEIYHPSGKVSIPDWKGFDTRPEGVIYISGRGVLNIWKG